MTYLNLIRSIAWAFHRNNQMEWEDLYGEAFLAYLEALQTYDPKKSKETTWIFKCVKNRLINFCKAEYRNKEITNIDWSYTTSDAENYEFLQRRFPKTLSLDTRIIIKMVLTHPLDYAMVPKKAIGQIQRNLRRRGWVWPRIDKGMANLRKELVEIK